MRYFCLLLTIGVIYAQDMPRSRVTVGGGWSREIGGFSYMEKETAPVLEMSYGYRVWKYLELNVGLTMALQPSPNQCSAHGCVDPDDRFYWVPFGVRFVAPIAWKRVEVSAGGGGLFERYAISNGQSLFSNVSPYNAWGGYFEGGAAVRLDGKSHWWVGAMPRFFLANGQYARDRWFSIAPEVSFRW
jgi:hypothetical protein